MPLECSYETSIRNYSYRKLVNNPAQSPSAMEINENMVPHSLQMCEVAITPMVFKPDNSTKLEHSIESLSRLAKFRKLSKKMLKINFIVSQDYRLCNNVTLCGKMLGY